VNVRRTNNAKDKVRKLQVKLYLSAKARIAVMLREEKLRKAV